MPNTETSHPIFIGGVRAVAALWRDNQFTVIPLLPGQESARRRAPSPAPPGPGRRSHPSMGAPTEVRAMALRGRGLFLSFRHLFLQS